MMIRERGGGKTPPSKTKGLGPSACFVLPLPMYGHSKGRTSSCLLLALVLALVLRPTDCLSTVDCCPGYCRKRSGSVQIQTCVPHRATAVRLGSQDVSLQSDRAVSSEKTPHVPPTCRPTPHVPPTCRPLRQDSGESHPDFLGQNWIKEPPHMHLPRHALAVLD